MNDLIALAVGLTAGAHIATWGMFKDSIHEGFTVRRYVRSIVVAGILSVGIARMAGLGTFHPSDLLLLFGLTYAVERVVMELYKGFLREEDQSKYFIPMQFHFLGRPVRKRGTRWAVAAGLVGFGAILASVLALYPSVPAGLPGAGAAFGTGAFAGLLVACGGAWKDGPFEGFEGWKFLRSPLVAGGYAVLLLPVTERPLFLALAGIGLSVATLETYKTFFFPSKPRGKFAGKPILYPGMLRARLRFVPLYVAIWMGILAAFVAVYRSGAAELGSTSDVRLLQDPFGHIRFSEPPALQRITPT